MTGPGYRTRKCSPLKEKLLQMQYAAPRCNMLQHAATCCKYSRLNRRLLQIYCPPTSLRAPRPNTHVHSRITISLVGTSTISRAQIPFPLQSLLHPPLSQGRRVLQCVAVCCRLGQCVAECGGVAARCDVLQSAVMLASPPSHISLETTATYQSPHPYSSQYRDSPSPEIWGGYD